MESRFDLSQLRPRVGERVFGHGGRDHPVSASSVHLCTGNATSPPTIGLPAIRTRRLNNVDVSYCWCCEESMCLLKDMSSQSLHRPGTQLSLSSCIQRLWCNPRRFPSGPSRASMACIAGCCLALAVGQRVQTTGYTSRPTSPASLAAIIPATSTDAITPFPTLIGDDQESNPPATEIVEIAEIAVAAPFYVILTVLPPSRPWAFLASSTTPVYSKGIP